MEIFLIIIRFVILPILMIIGWGAFFSNHSKRRIQGLVLAILVSCIYLCIP